MAPHTKVLDDKARLDKNKRIAQTRKENKKRRKNMDVLVRTVKIQRNKLSSSQREKLDRLFLEGKWLYNTALAYNQFDEKFRKSLNHAVEVKFPDGAIETRNLEVLGGQLQQGILSRMRGNLKGLAASKKKGHKVGSLKFISEMNSIPLVQFGGTHKIRGSKIKITNIPGWMRVKGLGQFTDTDEFASAELLHKGKDFFVAFTIYRNKDEHSSLATKKFTPDTTVGLDMGVSTHITFSDGSSVNARVEESDRLKRLSRKLARQEKGSKAFAQTKELISDEYRKVVNVFMQDENISSWRRKHSVARGSRSIHYGILGRVKAKLVDHPRVTVLKRNVATTATCICGEKTPHSLDKRTFSCPTCGYSAPRDLHAARNMYRLATKENIKT